MRTAVIYAAYYNKNFSGKEIEKQLTGCNEFAENYKIKIVRTYVDYPLGEQRIKRRAFRKLIGDKLNQKWKYVIVNDLNALGDNEQEIERNKKTLEQYGLTLLTATEPSDDEEYGGIIDEFADDIINVIKSRLKNKLTVPLDESDRSIGRKSQSLKKEDDGLNSKAFSLREEEDMNITVPGISVNSKPRADGRYQGYMIDNGVKKYVYGRSREEVVLKIKTYMKNGIPVGNKPKKDKTPTLMEWGEKWLELYKLPNLKPKSIEIIRQALKRLYDRFAGVRLGSLNSLELQEFFLSMPQSRSRDITLTTLNEMLEKARKQGIIKVNPCEGVEIKKHVQKKKKGLTPSEQQTLLEAVKGLALEPIFVLLLTGGFRIGELLALTDEDVDFETNTVTINKDVVFVNNKRVIQTTKTEAGTRKVILPQSSMEHLKGRKGVLFDVTYNSVRIAFGRLSKKTGIEVTAHILRHTYATRLEEAGIPPKVKQYLLGHASIEMTQNVYTDAQEHYVDSFSDKIKGVFDKKIA